MSYAQNRDDSAFIWDNCYEEKTRNNIYNLAVFVLNEDGAFDRYEENASYVAVHVSPAASADESTSSIVKPCWQDLHALPHMMHFHMMHQKMTAKDYILYLSVKMENKDV